MDLLKKITGSNKEEAPDQEAAERVAEPRHLTEAEFDEVTRGEQPVVVDFWAEWCQPCHMIAPFVEKLAGEYAGRILVGKLNADDYPDVLGRYGIMGIPTLIFFKGGQEVDRVIGFVQYGALKNKFERLAA